VDTAQGHERFDAIILACHSDQSARLLTDADSEELDILQGVRYGANVAYLHRDDSFMPRRRAAWGAWNYLRSAETGRVAVTYWMNPLQGLPADKPLFVTLNPTKPPAEDKTFARIEYDHPQFDADALRAQQMIHKIQGRGGVWHAGAWLGYGFHEDGLVSGLKVAAALGAAPPWRADFARFAPFEPIALTAARARAA
jgi:predicted NAD/FAD-binding protein